jgi:hypothetical protein
MAIDDDEYTKNSLAELNQHMVQIEQQGGEVAQEYFRPHLSDKLIFRRANGLAVGKAAFLEGLNNNPFQERHSEDVSVSLQGDRALVTLAVAGKRKDDGSVHRYTNIRLFFRSGEQWVLEFWYNYENAGL